MTLILGIDPGPTDSGWVVLDADNWNVPAGGCGDPIALAGELVGIEAIQPMGQVLSHDLLRTIRTQVALEARFPDAILVPRGDVKLALCGVRAAKETQVNAAVRAWFCQKHNCGEKQLKGTKAVRGPLYGVSGHQWAALAVALVLASRLKQG